MLLETGSNDALVDYTSGSGTSTLVFNYTVVEGHTTENSASGRLDYNGNVGNLQGGTIKDAAGNSASMLLPTIPSASLASTKEIYIDGSKPTVTSVTSSRLNGTYGVGDIIDIVVSFSEEVYYTGDPEILLTSSQNSS